MCGSVIVPIVLRIIRIGLIAAFDAEHAAGDEIAVAAGIFGQAVDDEVGALPQRLRPERPEEGVVDRDRRQLVAAEHRGARVAHRLDVDQRVGRVGRAFEIDRRDRGRCALASAQLTPRSPRASRPPGKSSKVTPNWPRMRAISVSVAA